MGFLEAEVDDLTPEQRSRFVESWHRALAIKLGCDEDDQDIMRIASNLQAALERQPKIALLATNPLLCAAICALHERNPGNLPKDEWDLCERLTRMLVEQRDRTHGRNEAIRLSEFGPAYQLPYNDKRSILARIAEAMVSQQLSALPRDEVLDHVASALAEQRSRHNLSAKDVLEALEARSGVLRAATAERARGEPDSRDRTLTDGPAPDAVEFAHNTLKAWLASLHCLSLNKPRELADRALTSGYPEVVAFATAAPDHRVYASKLIDRLLEDAPTASDDTTRRKLLMLAMHCDAVAPNLPQSLRHQLDSLPKRLFPPKNFEEAQQLALLGDGAVPHLAPRRRMAADKAAACVRCLRLIGTERARAAIQVWRDSKEPKTVEELADIFQPLTLPAVLDAAQSSGRWSQLPGSIKRKINSLEPIAKMAQLRSLFIWGTHITDIAELANLSKLQELDLSRTRVADITPLANLVELQWLNLSLTGVSNIASLAKLHKLQELYLELTSIAEIESLANLGDLRILYLWKTNVSNVTPLRKLANLRKLSLIDSRVTDISPLVDLNNLEELNLGSEGLVDISPLQSLISLRRLAVQDSPITDLTPLSSLKNLEVLTLNSNIHVADLTPLADLINLRELQLSNTHVADASPLVKLTNLRSLNLKRTQISQERVTGLKREFAEQGNRLLEIYGP